ncbi:MAG: GGDEF domain-containing protein, partial [Myxococcota bacterium]|nr:GGDEF domain-containing protein [Myxococcota bacterium]
AMLDLDHFKRVNDGLGHAAGDEALRRVARAVDAELRGGDGFGRLGGEEFVAVLTETDPLGAAGTAERLRRGIEALDLDAVAAGLRVTVSVGLAVWRPGDDAASLLARADRALYAAKGAGRNRVAWGGHREPAAASA